MTPLDLGDLSEVSGPRDVKVDGQPDTLAEYIYQLTQVNPEGRFVEIGADGQEASKSFGAAFGEARALAAQIAPLDPGPEQFVILCFESVQNYVPAAWACFLNGYSILPLSISGFFRNREVLAERMKQLTGRHGAFLVLTEPRFVETFEQICADEVGITVLDARVGMAGGETPEEGPLTFPPLEQSSDILVETSGTTGTPKLARIGGAQLITRFFGGVVRSDAVSLAMLGQNTIGGVRLLLPEGGVSIYMDPGRMMADTGTWLDVVVKYRVSQVGLSNSMAAKLNDWFAENETDKDLSSLKKLFFGSEMIVPDNIRQVIGKLEACGMSGATASLVYSMTETGPLFITTVPTDELYHRSKLHRGYFNLDTCFTSWRVRIVDDEDEVLPTGQVGSIQATSATRLFEGYHPGGTGIRDDGWFDTGDLGRLDENGLVLTGRKKSTIIINARKISTEEVELALSRIKAIKPGMLAAAAYRDADSQTDALAVFFVPKSWEADVLRKVETRIRGAVSKSIGVKIDHLVPVREDQIPRTASGKIKRDALCTALRDGVFAAPATEEASDASDMSELSWLEATWHRVLKLEKPPHPESNFFNDGGDSLASIELLMAVEAHFQCRISLERFYQNPTLARLNHLITQALADREDAPTVPVQVADASEVLRKLEVLCAPWVGQRAVPDGLVIGRNTEGRKPPLVWVCQSEWEFNALVEQLDPDQPVYGIRSLAGLVKTVDYAPGILMPLCRQILLELTALCPSGPLVVGGNCQGAIIALYLARQLREMNRRPKLLVLMEWMFSHGSYEGETLFLYGRESHTYEVFAGVSDAGPDWRAEFPNAVTAEIDGGHGRFFNPEVIPVLAGQLSDHLARVSPSEPLWRRVARRVFSPSSSRPIQRVKAD